MKCFKCLNVFLNPEKLRDHLKSIQCGEVLNKNNFKEHLRTCKRLRMYSQTIPNAEVRLAEDEAEVVNSMIVDIDPAEDEAEGSTEDNGAEGFPYGMTVDSDKLKSLLASWGVSPLYENLNACGINYVNMRYLRSRDLEIVLGDDKHLLGDMITFRHLLERWNTDSACNRPDIFEKNPTFVDVLKILQKSAKGQIFISNYQKHKLENGLRYELVSIILNETFSNDLVLSRLCLKDMARQICEIFTKEKVHVYYQKLRNQQPTGILLKRYTNMRHAQLEKQKKMATNDESDFVEKDAVEVYEVDNDESEVDNTDERSKDNVEASLKCIRDYTAESNKDLLLEHWKKTFEHRQQKFLEYVDIDELFADWPPLRKETGHALLCIDFVVRYGIQASDCLNNWESFFEKNLATISGIIKDTSVKRMINRLDSTTSLEAKNKIIIMALHHLLPPSTTVVDKEKWKPSIPMSLQSFMRSANGQHVMMSEMKKRDNFCKLYGMKNHPVIFEIITCMGTRYYVCIKDVFYKVESLVEGVDVAYKIFKILNIDFPLECKKVWKFIEHIFYHCDDTDDHISGNLLSIVSDMNE